MFTSSDLMDQGTSIALWDTLAGLFAYLNPSLSPAQVLAQELVSAILGDTTTTPPTVGLGPSAGQILRDMKDTLVDPPPSLASPSIPSLLTAISQASALGYPTSQVLLAQDRHVRRVGYTLLGASVGGLDGYASWYNAAATGTPYSTRIPPETAALWLMAQANQVPLSGANVFPDTTFLARYVRWMGAGSGATVPIGRVAYYLPDATGNGGSTTNYRAQGGSVPGIGATVPLQGYGAGVLLCKVEQMLALGNTISLTITGRGQDATGADHPADRTWSVTFDGTLNVGTVLTPTPTVSGDRIRNISAIVLASQTGTDQVAGQFLFYVGRDRLARTVPAKAANNIIFQNAHRGCC